MLPENSAHARVASGAYFVQQHAVLIKRGAAGVSSLSGEASGAWRLAMAAIAAVGELVAGGDRSAVMVTKSFFGRSNLWRAVEGEWDIKRWQKHHALEYSMLKKLEKNPAVRYSN
jgi:hypothetical protein